MRRTPDPLTARATRFPDNPLIHPGTPGVTSRNINGPSVLRVPAWVPGRLGRYYLYFSDHRGAVISLAYADDVRGPWTVRPGGVLRLEETAGVGHIASPDILVDEEERRIRLYFHSAPEGGQVSYVATSSDGLHFTARPEVLAPFYLRTFRHAGMVYGLVKLGNRCGGLFRSPTGFGAFERGPEVIPRMRHAAVWRRGEALYVFFSRIGDAPESILVTRWDLTGDWTRWDPEAPAPVEVLRPEAAWEGIAHPVAPSTPGPAVDVRQLRDPFVLEDDGRLTLFYTVAGELGIAGAALTVE